MRRVERAEDARWRSRYELELEEDEEDVRSAWRAGREVETGDGEGEGEGTGDARCWGRRRMEVVIGERTSAILPVGQVPPSLFLFLC